MKIINLEDSFEIYGVKTRTKNEDEIGGKGKIPALWSKFMSKYYDGKSEIYSVYCNYERILMDITITSLAQDQATKVMKI